MQRSTKVINIFGAPGAGKTALMCSLIGEMKRLGMSCELVTEYAKDLVWEHRSDTFTDELYIFAKQNHRLHRVNGQVDWIVTDRPLPLSIIYARKTYGKCSNPFFNMVWSVYEEYDNINYLLLLDDSQYEVEGRLQTFDESRDIQKEFLHLLGSVRHTVVTRQDALNTILKDIYEEYPRPGQVREWKDIRMEGQFAVGRVDRNSNLCYIEYTGKPSCMCRIPCSVLLNETKVVKEDK